MCSGFTHQHTVEETHPRSQTVRGFSSPLHLPSPNPPLQLTLSPAPPTLRLNPSPLCFPLPLNALAFASPSTVSSPAPPLYPPPSLPPPTPHPPKPPPLSPPSSLPGGFHHRCSVFSIFNVFYLSKEARAAARSRLPNKGETPSCHLRER